MIRFHYGLAGIAAPGARHRPAPSFFFAFRDYSAGRAAQRRMRVKSVRFRK